MFPRIRLERLLFVAAWATLTAGLAGADGPDPTPTAPGDESPEINIFLRSPAELGSLWAPLAEPDFVLMKGAELRKLLDRAKAGAAGAEAGGPAVEAVAVHGAVAGDLANLQVDLLISSQRTDAAWVPIRLDGQNIEAHEGDRVLPVRAVEPGGWQVEIRGAGSHRVRIDFAVRLKLSGDDQRLEIAIPPAASTSLALDVPRRVAQASSGAGEPIVPEARPGGAGSRLKANLTPRPRLDVRWRAEAESGAQLPPLLIARGEIAIDIDPATFRTRSSWAIQSVRGPARVLEFRVDPDDEVLELEVDGQPAFAGVERVDGTTRLTIPLAEPLRPGPPKLVVLTTRRPLSAGPSARVSFGGFPLTDAKEQSGAIGIAQGENLWVSGTAGRGLRPIDPRTELTPELRSRPATVLGYQFTDQPFELGLRVEASPPLVRAESRTTVALSARKALVDVWLDYQTAHGRLFELGVGLPRGLELESVGPPDVVLSSTVGADVTSAALPPGVEPGRLLTVRLSARARELGVFSLHLTGRQAIDPARPVRVGLFQPREASSGGGRIAVVADRDLTIDSPEREDGRPGDAELRPAVLEPPADWPWPDGRPATAALWLRYDGAPPALPLRIAVHPRSTEHETRLRGQLDRRWLELVQTTDCTVHFGTIDRVEIAVPASLKGRWDVEGGTFARREELGQNFRGDRLYRLWLAKGPSDRVRLRFRSRVPLAPPLSPTRAAEVALTPIRVVDGRRGTLHLEVEAGPELRVEPVGSGWERPGAEDAVEGRAGGPGDRLSWSGTEDPGDVPRVRATAGVMARLPAALATRLWLRTVQGPEGDLRTTARYWMETHQATLALALPPGAELAHARIAGESIGQVEQLPEGRGIGLRFPERLAGAPALVEIEYATASRLADATCRPPRLPDGAEVGQTYWEVRVPWNRAVVGVPAGWSDENGWSWDRYVWKRRPWKGEGALRAWIRGVAPASLGPRDEPEDGLSGENRYLFGRPGPPAVLPLLVAPRAWLLGLCSGTVLGLAFLLLSWRPPARLAALAFAAIGLAVAAAADPGVTLLAVQSASLGILLVPLAALLKRVVDRRRPGSVFGDPNGLIISPTSGSSIVGPSGVGYDDSTEIRIRPSASTMDHHPLPQAADPSGASGRGYPGDRG